MESYIEKLKEVYSLFLQYVDCEKEETEGKYYSLSSFLKEQHLLNNKGDLRLFLHLINSVSANHHRSSGFRDKLEKLLTDLKSAIKTNFSNDELYDIFPKNDFILLILLENKILTVDSQFVTELTPKFFSPEIETFSGKSDRSSEKVENFEAKRRLGENDSRVCEIIRSDSVQELSQFVTLTSYDLKSTIESSLFETNDFLRDQKATTLIEYAVFQGSIQIFKYLKANKVPLSESLFLYAIHSDSAEIIAILEDEINQDDDDKSFLNYYIEATKCHHCEVADHFYEKLNTAIQNDPKFKEKVDILPIEYYCFNSLPDELNHVFLFNAFCQFDYLTIVKFYFENKLIDFDQITIQNFCFLIQFKKFHFYFFLLMKFLA